MKPHRVAVTFLDHCETGEATWVDVAGASKATPVTVRAVGWVIRETPTYLVLVSQLTDGGQCGQPLVVVSSCIVDRRNL